VRSPARPAAGFTLVEVLVVVTVLALLAAVAIPSYQNYVVRSKRALARQVLVEGAQYLERVYTAAGCYDFADAAACAARSGTAVVIPTTLTRAPIDGRMSHSVTWSFSASGQNFTLTAIPCGAGGSCPAGSETSYTDSACGSLSLTHTGQRGASAAGADVGTCWQR
jgi:type IV pilus assembly protein PilE